MERIEAWFADKVAKHGLKVVILVSVIVVVVFFGLIGGNGTAP